MQLSKMLADILVDAGGLTELDLGSNGMDDAAVCGVMEVLGADEGSSIQVCVCGGGERQACEVSEISGMHRRARGYTQGCLRGTQSFGLVRG